MIWAYSDKSAFLEKHKRANRGNMRLVRNSTDNSLSFEFYKTFDLTLMFGWW